MTRKAKVWLIAIAALLIFGIVGWFSGMPFGLQGRDLWILRGALWLAGLLVTCAAARRQLASARLTGGTTIGKFPLVLLVGPEGSAKTTIVVRSGLEPELLAGEVFRGETVAPTRAVNVWYSSDTIFVEAGGKVLAEPAAW